ncbi:MAG TPA: hypothetical protein VGA11_05690, partial [Acidimicrobiia bacterium]
DLVVIDTATGASRVVASLGEYASVPAWSSDSVHLFVMTSNDYNARSATVVMYNMGTHALRTGTVPVGVATSIAVERDKVASLLEVPTGSPEQCLQVKNIPPTQTMPCGYRF